MPPEIELKSVSNRARGEEEAMADQEVKALVFDVFGTVVDWRTSVAAEVDALAAEKGWSLDGTEFAMRWRAKYFPSMLPVRRGAASHVRQNPAKPALARSQTIQAAPLPATAHTRRAPRAACLGLG